MAINYSLVLKNKRVNDPSVKLVYGVAQSQGNMSLKEFAAHIAEHGSVFGRAEIEAVLIKAVEHMREQLLLGRIIELGEMGNFSIALRTKGAPTATDFTAKNIKRVLVKWRPGPGFRNLLPEASFQYVTTRLAQAMARKGEKTELDEEAKKPAGGGVVDGQ